MGVIWGNVKFTGPYPIKSWIPIYQPGLYAIMYKPKPTSDPSIYSVIYFGKSSNLSDREFYRLHPKYECWIKKTGSENNLYIGIHLMPNSIEEKRNKIAEDLVNILKPICND